MRTKAAIQKLLLFAISLAVSLTIVEVGYRLKMGIPLLGNMSNLIRPDGSKRAETFERSSNEILLYAPKPGAHSLYTGVDNFISEQGLRDRVYPLKKPRDTFRIAFVGDSVVYGFGIPVEETMPKQLEGLLNQNPLFRKKFEVINFGVPGYGTVQEVEWYRVKVKPFAPDMVIIGYCLNDSFTASWEYEMFAGQSFPLWTKFYWLDALKNGVNSAVERKRFAETAPKNRVHDPVFRGMKSIKDKIFPPQPTLLVVIPALQPFDDYKEFDIHNRVLEAASYYGVTHFDLFEKFSKYNCLDLRVRQYRNKDYTHLGRFGNKVAAEAIMEWLMTKYEGRDVFLKAGKTESTEPSE